MSEVKPLVLVVGGTGNTGISILKALAKTGAWRLAVSVRSSSMSKPEVSTLKDLGVEIRVSDWLTDSNEELDRLFAGVNIAISTVNSKVIPDQKVLVDAAKRANVKRFIPCDFATPCIPGVRHLFDEKLEVQYALKTKGVPYTFIDVGIWMHVTLPYPPAVEGFFPNLTRLWCGDGNQKTALCNLENVGEFVARIIADPRTLNQYVFIYDEEVTLNEIYEIANRATGLDFHKIKTTLSEAEIRKRIVEAKAACLKGPDPAMYAMWSTYEYGLSIYFAGHNTPEFAKSQGALLGKELYPDMKFQSVADFAVEFYKGFGFEKATV